MCLARQSLGGVYRSHPAVPEAFTIVVAGRWGSLVYYQASRYTNTERCSLLFSFPGARRQPGNGRGRELSGGQAPAAAALLHQHSVLPAAES